MMLNVTNHQRDANKTTVGYHFTLGRMATINISTTVSAGEDVEKGESQCIVGGNAVWCSQCGKQYDVFSKKLKMELPFDPVIPLLGIYAKNPQTPIGKNIYTPMLVAVLFNSQDLGTAQVPISR